MSDKIETNFGSAGLSVPGKMKIFHVIITLLSCATHVISGFQCQGTCYSGSFPKNNQIIEGKHLRGHSYKNITTDVPRTCFSSCVNDCRCKAFQMKGVRCELLDEDKTSKAAHFANDTGYVYYNLQQTFYKGKSHMVHPLGVCYNGCCRSLPCMNGGTCVEHCEKPKVKFSCKCPQTHFGKVCESKIGHSCMDVLRRSLLHGILPADGEYDIIHKDTRQILPRYCAFDGFNQAWTLIESFAFGNKDIFQKKVFYQDYPVEDMSPNWNKYRLSLSNIRYTRVNATFFRATCDFPRKNSSLAPDYLLGKLIDYDPIEAIDTNGVCIKVVYVNIKGEECYNCAVPAFQKKYYHHLHLDFRVPGCSEFAAEKLKRYEDNFGYYGVISPGSSCTATVNATTQWWLGEQQ